MHGTGHREALCLEELNCSAKHKASPLIKRQRRIPNFDIQQCQYLSCTTAILDYAEPTLWCTTKSGDRQAVDEQPVHPNTSQLLNSLDLPRPPSNLQAQPPMCIHSLNIFSKCGHYIFSSHPLIPCKLYSAPSTQDTSSSQYSSACDNRAHPFRTHSLDRLCTVCERQREERLSESMDVRMNAVVEDVRWRVTYWHGPKAGPSQVARIVPPTIKTGRWPRFLVHTLSSK